VGLVCLYIFADIASAVSSVCCAPKGDGAIFALRYLSPLSPYLPPTPHLSFLFHLAARTPRQHGGRRRWHVLVAAAARAHGGRETIAPFSHPFRTFVPTPLSPYPPYSSPFFSGLSPYLILRVTGFDFASGPIPGNIPHCGGGGGGGGSGKREYMCSAYRERRSTDEVP
jgi:hypothetical protein